MSRRHFKRAALGTTKGKGLSFNLGSNDAVWGLHECTALRAYRFSEFARHLGPTLRQQSDEIRALLCAIREEGLVKTGDLLSFAKAFPNRVRLPKGSRVAWLSAQGSESRMESRYLHPQTELAFELAGGTMNWENALKSTSLFLYAHYPRIGEVNRDRILEEVLLDASAWLYQYLPSCLFSHLHGALSMPSLPDSVFRGQMGARGDKMPFMPASVVDHAIGQLNDEALDIVFDLPANDKPRSPERTIAHLKSICSVAENETGIRLATHLNRAGVKDKIALSTSAFMKDGWVGATLAAWVTFLLSHGSVRKENPAVSTISSYVNDLLVPFSNVLIRFNKPPAMLLQSEWEAMFDVLCKGEGSAQRGAALASLHLWAVRTFGCDPLPHVIFSRGPSAQIHANILWPNELVQAFSLAALASLDERINNQCKVLLTLGSEGLFRIGELPTLMTKHVQKTRDGLRIEVDPGRGSHGGKSRAARRVVLIHPTEAVSVIIDWRDAEPNSHGNEGVLLFGDPHQNQKLYRFGHCTRLVNEILKNATGDDNVSFHTLRHSSATNRCLQLFQSPQVPTAVSPLDELCHQMGHAHSVTLWNTYFHLPEFAIRTAIDRAPEVSKITAVEAAFWTGIKAPALRQMHCRMAPEDADGLYSKLIEKRAWENNPVAKPIYQTTEPHATPTLDTSDSMGVNLEWIRHALMHLQARADSRRFKLLQSCTDMQLKTVCLAIQSALQPLKSKARQKSPPLLLESADVEHHARWAFERLQKHEWKFEIPAATAANRLTNYLEAHADDSVTVRSAQAWASMFDRNVLSLHDDVATRTFLSTLKAAKYPAQALVARVQEMDDKRSTADRELHRLQAIDDIQRLTMDSLDTNIRIETVRPRRGFPRRYLLIGRSPVSPDCVAPSASMRMREVNGLFFALNVLHQVRLMGWAAV
jgi:integrase